VSAEKTEQEKKILDELTAVIGKDLSEKFKYAKAFDFEKQSFIQVLEILQKYFRNQLLLGSHDAMRILKLIDEINFKIATTNANSKLALEVLLMKL
jgi:hypothetical protein